jgi:hypothetical protein
VKPPLQAKFSDTNTKKVFIFVSPKCTFLSVSEAHEALEFGDI